MSNSPLSVLKKLIKKQDRSITEKAYHSLTSTYCRIANVEESYVEDSAASFFSGSIYRTCFITDVIESENASEFKFHFTVFGEADVVKSFYAPVKILKNDNGGYLISVAGGNERYSDLNGNDKDTINEIMEFAAINATINQ